MELPKHCLIEDLGEYEPISWYWHGYVAPTRKTMFVGHPKAGKTTLISHLIKGFSGATAHVGPPVIPVKTLLITEEHPDHWRRRRELLGIAPKMIGIMPIIKRYTDQKEWAMFLGLVTKLCLDEEYKCVIIDTLSSLWPVQDENCAVAAGLGLEPLNIISEAGIALLCVHHAPKGKSQMGLSGRGSTAITAFFDVIVDMKRHGKGVHNTRRKLTSWSRDLETPEVLAMQYVGSEGYENIQVLDGGDEDHMEELEVQADLMRITDLLPEEAPGKTMSYLTRSLGMGSRSINRILDSGIKDGTVVRLGSGRKGDPNRWYLNNGRSALTPIKCT